MKITRKMLLIFTASLGALIIVYSLVRHFFKIGLSETMERWLMDGVIIAALGAFMYNRKMARDEKLAKEAARKEEEEAERRRLEGEEPEAESQDDENIPHWERNKEIKNSSEDEENTDENNENEDIKDDD